MNPFFKFAFSGLLFLHVQFLFSQNNGAGSILNHGFQSGELQTLIGTASSEKVGSELRITASDGSVIRHAHGFDVRLGETVRFLQPGTDSIVINQILSNGPSLIDGNVFGNGKVVLVNPEGFVFGQTAVLEASRLQVIAGNSIDDYENLMSNPDFDTDDLQLLGGYELTGKIENYGIIQAEDIIFAGNEIINGGEVIASDGFVQMIVSEIVGLYESADPVGQPQKTLFTSQGAVADTLGIALLQSGIMDAAKVGLHSNKMSLDGTIEGEEQVTISSTLASEESLVSQSETGLIRADLLKIEDLERVELVSFSNEFSKVSLSEADSLSVYSDIDMELASLDSSPLQSSFISIQEADFRVSGGDLSVSVSMQPSDLQEENSLLLAAENNLILSSDYDQFPYVRKIAFGRNMLKAGSTNDQLDIGSTITLDASGLFLKDLSSRFTASMIKPLALHNPEFKGFDSQGREVNLLELQDSQLEILLKYGLFVNYSYLLEAPSSGEVFVNELEKQETGLSSLYGGDYQVFDTQEIGPPAEMPTVLAEGTANIEIMTPGQQESFATEPFSAIGQPVPSVEAGNILGDAMSPEIEQRMKGFLLP